MNVLTFRRADTPIGITNVQDTTPIVITLAEKHWLKDGEQVHVEGVPGPTEVNTDVGDPWVGTVVDDFSVSLSDSLESGAFVDEPVTEAGVAYLLNAHQRWYPCAAHELWSDITTPDDHGSTGTFVVQAYSQPDASTNACTVRLYGRPTPDADWIKVHEVDYNHANWAVAESYWLTHEDGVKLYPEMTMRVVKEASSTNQLKAWLIT